MCDGESTLCLHGNQHSVTDTQKNHWILPSDQGREAWHSNVWLGLMAKMIMSLPKCTTTLVQIWRVKQFQNSVINVDKVDGKKQQYFPQIVWVLLRFEDYSGFCVNFDTYNY